MRAEPINSSMRRPAGATSLTCGWSPIDCRRVPPAQIHLQVSGPTFKMPRHGGTLGVRVASGDGCDPRWR